LAVDINLNGSNLKVNARLTAAIVRLELTQAYRKPLSEPHCGDWTPAGLVTRTIKYRSGRIKKVTLHAKVMVAYLKALKLKKNLEVTASSDSMYSGSYRSYAQQNTLYQMYKAGTGYKAANPCYGYHRCGRAIDLLALDGDDRKSQAKAMTSVRVAGERFYHGVVFGDPPHYSFAVTG
jgi:hypothetical protein